MAIIATAEFRELKIKDAYIKVHLFANIEIYENEEKRKAGGRYIDTQLIELNDDSKKAIYAQLKQMFPDAVDCQVEKVESLVEEIVSQ